MMKKLKNQEEMQNPLENVDEIFENLNFLKLKQTAKMFLKLPDSTLEKFSEKYSGVLIYLLNILDHDNSSKLISKLTTKSILYLIEEEIRLLLLSEFRLLEENFEELARVSFLIDELDFQEGENFLSKQNFEEIKNALEILSRSKSQKQSIKFHYLMNFSEEHLKELIQLIMKKKPIIISILMIFAPIPVKQFLLQEVIKNYPKILKVLPVGIYELKYYSFLMKEVKRVIEYLPQEVITKLEYLEIVKRLETGLDKLIAELKSASIPEKKRREKILDQIYEILLPESYDIQELLLVDLLNKNYITPKETELLLILFQQENNT